MHDLQMPLLNVLLLSTRLKISATQYNTSGYEQVGFHIQCKQSRVCSILCLLHRWVGINCDARVKLLLSILDVTSASSRLRSGTKACQRGRPRRHQIRSDRSASVLGVFVWRVSPASRDSPRFVNEPPTTTTTTHHFTGNTEIESPKIHVTKSYGSKQQQ